jgi:uncharacterized protein YozE (UPF0346 family)
MRNKLLNLSSFYVVPGYTFFYWGFTLQKAVYSEYIKYFNLNEDSKFKPIQLRINKKEYDAKIRIARINNKGKIKTRSDTIYPERDVVQIFYNKERDTLAALRKLMIYSYASTIRKSKPKLKELLEFIHIEDDTFKIKVISKQETDFDEMFHFLEENNLFAYYQNQDKKDKIFRNYSRQWLPKTDLKKYSTRSNVIYLLNNSKTNELYIGRAKIFGERVKDNSSRVGLKSFDRFLFFELHPDFSFRLNELENFSITLLASILTNMVGIKGLDLEQMTLVNKHIQS